MLNWLREKIVLALGGTMKPLPTERVANAIYEAAMLADAMSAGRHKRIWLTLDKEGIWVQGIVPQAHRQANECVRWETIWLRPGWLEPTIRRIDKMMDQAWRDALKKDGVDDASR